MTQNRNVVPQRTLYYYVCSEGNKTSVKSKPFLSVDDSFRRLFEQNHLTPVGQIIHGRPNHKSDYKL